MRTPLLGKRSLTRFGWIGAPFIALVVVLDVSGHWVNGPPAYQQVVNAANIVSPVLAFLLWFLDRWRDTRTPSVVEESVRARQEALARTMGEVEGAALRAATAVERPPGSPQIELSFRRHPVRYRAAGGAEQGTSGLVRAYWNGLRPRRLVILGTPGSGKTVLALNLITQLLDERQAGDVVPIRLSLSSYRPGDTLRDWLAAQLVLERRYEPAMSRALVDRGAVLPVVDGLDELDRDGTDPRNATAVVTALNGYFVGAHRGAVVVTCRADRYDQLPSGILEATVVEVDPLDAQFVAEYLQGQVVDASDELAWQDVIAALDGAFGPQTQERVAACLDSPWKVTLALAVSRSDTPPNSLFFRSDERDAGAVRTAEDVRVRLLDRFVPALLALHAPGTDPPSDAVADRALDGLRVIARYLRDQELRGHVGELRLDAWWQVVARRARQVHALLAGGLAVLGGVGVFLGFGGPDLLGVAALHRYLVAFPAIEISFLGAAGIFVLGGTAVPFLAAWRASTADISPRQITGLGSVAVLRALLVGLVAGLAVGVLVGAGVGFFSGLSIGPLRSLLVGSVGGGIGGLTLGAAVSASRENVHAVEPRSVIVNDLAAGVATASLLAIVQGVVGVAVVGPAFGLAVSTTLFTLYVVVWGAPAGVRYLLTVSLLYLISGRRLPLRFARFLTWACEAGIMRAVGSTYQFRHRELHDVLGRAPGAPTA